MARIPRKSILEQSRQATDSTGNRMRLDEKIVRFQLRFGPGALFAAGGTAYSVCVTACSAIGFMQYASSPRCTELQAAIFSDSAQPTV